MSVLTPFGYEMTSYPDILTTADFNTMTGNRFSGNTGVASAIAAATQAVRTYCGWHVSPAVACTYTGTAYGNILMLPFMGVSSLTSVKENGTSKETSAYTIVRHGWLIKNDELFEDGIENIEVTATAGFSDDPLLKSIVCQIAANAVASPAGVREEHAGDVGITYNQTASGVSGGVALLARDKEMLAPYCITGASL